MSVQIKTVEFERRDAFLSELDSDPPWTVHGVALGAGDVTVGQSSIKKLWPAGALKESADSLEGKNLVVDHDNKSSGVVGQVTKAGYKEGTGVIYEAELFDEELAEKISNGLLEVSIRGRHIDVDEMEENEDGAKIVEGIEFDNLSVVPTGAAPSNSIEIGETEELSVAELAAFTSQLQDETEIEPGMWVKSDDTRGITISLPDGGEIEVDIYEESDGKWRSTGETEMVSVNSLTAWDVDEEEDIGPTKDEEEEASEHGDIPDKFFFESEEDAMDFIEDKDGLTGVHEMDDMYVPGDTHEEFLEWWNEDSDEMQEGAPNFEEGQMVQWQVNPDMFGRIVHAPEDENIVMVEIMERMDGEMESTGFTVTAGYSDLMMMDEDLMSSQEELESFTDYPEAASENAQMALDAREETDNPNDCGTRVGWARANQLASREPVSEDVVARMASFNRHRGNKDQGDDGRTDCGWMMWKAWGGDEGVDWAMNKMDKEELQDYEMHTPDWSGTTESDWSSPDMEDFDTDDLEEIAAHFLISATGFPPENFTDLKLPVVEPNGDLNINALAAVKGGRGVSAVDGLSSEMEDEIVEWVNKTANDPDLFDRDWGKDEEEARALRERTVDDTGEEPGVYDSGPVDLALDVINKYLTIEGNHERDTVDNMLSWLIGSVDLPIETLDDFRMVSRRFLDEAPGADSFDAMTVEQFRDWLLMHGKESRGRREQDESDRVSRRESPSVNVLTGDDLQQMNSKSGESELDDITTKVTNMTDIEEELEELDEPVAVEQEDLEDLQSKADRFEEMSETLESLKDRTELLDNADREQVEELADSEEPVVVESARYEQLQDEAEQVKTVYAAALSEEIEAFDSEELADRFSIEELREKYEEQIGDPAEELASSEEAEPRSGDVDEEELEGRAEEETEEASEEEDEAAKKRAELRDKIIGGD